MPLSRVSSGPTAVFALDGRLDLRQAPLLREALTEAIGQGQRRIYLNLAAVSFMDSAGLAALISGLKAARAHGGEFYLVAPSEPVCRVLELTLLDQIIPIRQTLEAVG